MEIFLNDIIIYYQQKLSRNRTLPQSKGQSSPVGPSWHCNAKQQ